MTNLIDYVEKQPGYVIEDRERWTKISRRKNGMEKLKTKDLILDIHC